MRKNNTLRRKEGKVIVLLLIILATILLFAFLVNTTSLEEIQRYNSKWRPTDWQAEHGITEEDKEKAKNEEHDLLDTYFLLKLIILTILIWGPLFTKNGIWISLGIFLGLMGLSWIFENILLLGWLLNQNDVLLGAALPIMALFPLFSKTKKLKQCSHL